MHSPKFPLKLKDIKVVINIWRLKSTWKSKVRDAMRRQAIPDPLEHLDFHAKLDANCAAIESEICRAGYIPRPPVRFLSEKSQGLCRQLVIPSIKDALILQTLSDALWEELRKKAPTKKAFFAPNDHHFSKFMKGHSSEYGPVNAWLAFQQSIFGFAKTKKYIVVTDISNYYDFVSYDHLRNVLADLSVAREHALDLLIYTLSCMLWQPDYMPRVPVGLPQSILDAPRLLAHCFLFEVDELLASNKDIDFARYMDDIDVGCDDVLSAKRVLRDLDLTLQTRQIRLNSGKTRILTEHQAAKHFKIRENQLLDQLYDRISVNMRLGLSLEKDKRWIRFAFNGGFRRQVFSTGNGDKILKRLVNIARYCRADIDKGHFEEMLASWPSMRHSILQWWQHIADPTRRLDSLVSYVKTGAIVDDATPIEIANALVSARLPKAAAVQSCIDQVVASLDPTNQWSLYARIWILSKYGTSDDLMKIIEGTTSVWMTQEHLSRVSAGMYPRFLGTPYQRKFEAIISRAANGWSQSVLDFHKQLSSGTSGYTGIRQFVSAENPSLPNKISHSKFLLLASLLHNKSIAPIAIGSLKKTHAFALSDAYYQDIVT
jgi:hypothetical protein